MGLRNIQIKRAVVEYNGGKIELRGITGSDLMIAAQDYAPELAMAFAQVTSGEGDTDMKSAILSVSREFPDLIAATIALASGEYDDETVGIARDLPFPTQLACVEDIFNSTFTSEAEVKKFVESLTRLIAAASGALDMVLGSVSVNGTGASDAKLAS